MNRTIKFRGKCSPQSKYKGEWVTGSLVIPEQIKDNEVLIVVAHSDNCKTTYHVNKDTVGQFTGLYDKNGKEIYEGDILLFRTGRFTSKSIAVVFHNGAFGYFYTGDFVSFVGNTNFKFCINGSDESFEIIGNIHDSTELIKEK